MYIMVRMGAYMGVYWDTRTFYDSLPPQWLEPGPGGQNVLNAGVYPAKPAISREDFLSIVHYVDSLAPVTLQGPPDQLTVAASGAPFAEHPLYSGTQFQPLVSAVKIDERNHQILASFIQQDVVRLSSNGKELGRLGTGTSVVDIDIAPDGRISMSDIGSMKGSDAPKGSFVSAPSFNALKQKPDLAFGPLMRPVQGEWFDADRDGDADLLVCEFGYHLGSLSLYRNQGSKYEKEVLFGDDGATRVHVADINGDGFPDFFALFANADEGIDLFTNDGTGHFTRKRLFRFSPTYGSTALQVLDWDSDGDTDLLYGNGDNADFPPVYKPHHGIRLYTNDGQGNFSQTFYLPLSGVYGLQPRDYDLDGDMDIATVSFYPNYQNRITDSFVYFRNDGGNTFSPFSIANTGTSRWMVMDSGDLDGDGDADIILGAFNVKSSDAEESLYQEWMKNDVPLLWLENTAK